MTLNRYIIKDGQVSIDKNISERIRFGSSEIVMTSCGDAEPFLIVLRSGDYCVATQYSLFASKASISDGFVLKGRKQTIKMIRPCKPTPFITFMKPSDAQSLIQLSITKEMLAKTKELAKAFWQSTIFRKKFDYTPLNLLRLRNCAQLFGYNVKLSKKGYLYLTFHRSKKSKVNYICYPFNKGDKITAYQFSSFNVNNYGDQGFKI